jgi:hypothetical protein
MKITKTQIRKIVKEALLKEAGRPHSMRSGRSMGDLDREAKMRETDYLPSKSTDLDLARDAARPADPIGPQEAYTVIAALEDLGFVTTLGGRSRLVGFLQDLETDGDLRRQ